MTDFKTCNRRLARDEFAEAVRKGLGRAILHLQRHGAGDFFDLILDACTTDHRYDRQCESRRTEYAHRLAKASRRLTDVRDHLIKLAREAPDGSAVSHGLDVVALMARGGDAEAMAAVRDRFERDAPRHVHESADALIEAEPVAGLVRVAQLFGDEFDDEDDWLPRAWISDAKEIAGEGAVDAALSAAAAHDPRIAAFVRLGERIDALLESLGSAAEEPVADIWTHLAAVIDLSVSRIDLRLRCSEWSRLASFEQKMEAAAALVGESDPKRIAALCEIFRNEPYPLDVSPVIDAARCAATDELRRNYLMVLENIDDERVRLLALELLDEYGAQSEIIDLFIENHRPGDSRILMEAIARRGPMEIDDLHWVAMSLSKVYEDGERAEGRDLLLWSYESTPCANCRACIMRALLRAETAPDWLVQECVHDCDDWTRRNATAALAGEPFEDID